MSKRQINQNVNELCHVFDLRTFEIILIAVTAGKMWVNSNCLVVHVDACVMACLVSSSRIMSRFSRELRDS